MDTALDIVTNFGGIYVLATIGNYFLPHMSNQKVWETEF